MKRVVAGAGLGLAWFVLVAVGAAMVGHSQAGVSVAVLIFLGGPFLGGLLVYQATEELDGIVPGVLWLAWGAAGVLGMIAMIGGSLTYEPAFGRPEAVIVTETRCLPDSDDNGCDPQARVSAAANERDLGWLMDCDPVHAPGQATEVLADPHGWFQPQLSTCAGYGSGFRLFLAASAGYVATLTLIQVVWLGRVATRESRQLRRLRRTEVADPTRTVSSGETGEILPFAP